MKKLRIARGFALMAEDFVEQATAIIGKRGTGKTGLSKVLMEELSEAGLPFVCFDPIGIAYGLRSSFDGKEPGFPVLVIGGPHGDIRLEKSAGAEIAKAIVQANISTIIDFSEESKNSYRKFIADFSHAIFSLNDSPRVVIIDEAPELVPQRFRPDMAEVYESVERLVSRGRNKAIGVVLISQRAATIAKDVLTQVDTMFLFGMPSPQDRKAVWEWVEVHGEADKLDQFEKGIAGLQPRECWVWAPAASLFQKIRVRDFRTFHPDKTHLRRTGLLAVKPVTSDVSGVIAKLGTAMEKLSKEKDAAREVKKLGAEVSKLRRQRDELEHLVLEARGKVQDPKAVQRAVGDAMAPLKKENAELRQELSHLQKAVSKVRVALDLIDLDKQLVAAIRERTMPAQDVYLETAKPTMYPPEMKAQTVRFVASKPINLLADNSHGEPAEIRMTKAHSRIVLALARLHGIGIAKPTKTQVALWSAYSPTSGGFYNYLGQLRSAGLTDYGGDATIFLTDAGKDFVASMQEQPEIPSNEDELRDQIFRMVGESRTRILKVLLETYPDPVSKSELAERAGFSPTSGGYYNYLGNLRSMGLINYTGGGVVATGVLFLET